jgi:drug/metabolite transporter (DMT)-like permease
MITLSPNLRGAALMSAGMAFFTVNDAFIKALSDELPLFQAVLLRGLATSLLIFLIARRMGALRVNLSPRDWGIVAIRAVAEIGAAWFFITALFNMPLANATAILQSLPLTITLAGALFLGEAVGWRRMLAIAIGFGGVLMIVRPGAAGFTVYSLYALASVVCVTLRDLSTRRLSKAVPSLSVALASAVAVMLFGAVGTAASEWVPVSPLAWAQLVGAALAVTGGYLCSVLVMRAGDIGLIAPFRYTSLVWSLLLGLVLFGDWPDGLTLTGAGIVAATGIFTLWREQVKARQARSVTGPQ